MNGYNSREIILTFSFKATSKIVAEGILFFFFFSGKIRLQISCELLDLHEMSSLFLLKKKKKKMISAADVIGISILKGILLNKENCFTFEANKFPLRVMLSFESNLCFCPCPLHPI